MKQYTQEKDFCTEKNESWSVLEQIAQEGARKLLQQALELEIEEYIWCLVLKNKKFRDGELVERVS